MKNGRFLLGNRSAEREFYPDVWDVFGGHMQPSETSYLALMREVYEELGIIPTQVEYLQSFDHCTRSQDSGRRYHVYLVLDWLGEPRNCQPDEHSEIAWLTVNEALSRKLADPLLGDLLLLCASQPD